MLIAHAIIDRRDFVELVNQKWIEMPPDIVTGHHQLQQMLEEGNWEALDHGYKCPI